MDYQSQDALALFNKSRHEIRGMQVVSNDFVPFQKDRKLKITGTALNAVGALIQQVNEEAGNSDFAIFSTLLSPLISKQLPQNKMYGTIIGHIQAACQGAPVDILLAKSRWLFPMYGSAPPHWVLGWIEPGPRLFHIFDSMPELNSVSWAEPALLELGDTVYATLGRMEVDWEPWKRVLHSPDELDRQMNNWACGLFVIHAMKSLADGIGIKGVKNGETERVRESTLKLVLDNLCRFRPPETEVQMQDNIEMTQGMNQFIDDARMDIDLPEPLNIKSERIAIVEPANVTIPDTSSSKRKIEETADNGSVESARQTSIATSSGIEISTHENPQQAKKARKAYTKCRIAKRLSAGCTRWIKLDQRADQPFKPENWNRHENKCPQITGLDRTRTAVKKPVKVVTGKASIASFFGNLQKPEPKPAPEPVPEPSSLKGNDASDSESDSGRISNVTYTTLLVNATPSVTTFFAPGPITSHPRVREASPEPPERRSCQHLSGGDYIEYIERTETRTMGGISPKLRGRVIRQIFMYKKLRALKRDDDTPAQRAKRRKDVEKEIPVDGNDCLASMDWTEAEHVRLSEVLKGHARWEVNYVRKFLSKDDSLRHAVNRKKREAQLPEEEQHEILMARNKYSSRRFLDDEARNLNDQLRDPLTFKAFKLLQKGESTECFFQLYEACLNGKLKKYETFQQLCGVLADGLEREGTNKKFGVRYPKDYLNFMILLRSYGGQSSRQYGIIAGQFPAQSSRHLRSLVAKSEDALTNPYLVYENMARVRRLINTLNYTGPVAVAGDCTKVRSRLTYCHDYGGHILGSVLPFEETIVEDPKEIDAVIAKITKAKAQASQVRAILVKVPLPQVPPQVVALIPTDGKDDAPKIMEQNLKLLQMAAQLDLKVVSFAADGAASELAAQTMFENLKTDFLPLTYEYVLFGIRLRTPVFETGPAVAVIDAPHSSKTGRNQPQHGTHTASMGLVDDLATELLSLVFLHLPYTSLLTVQRMCKQWKTIVDEDTALQVQLFRKESKVYVDAGDGQTASWPLKHTIAPLSQPVRIHPAAQMVCYSMPMKIEDIQICSKAKPSWKEKDHWPHLVDLSIANDLLAIPSVTTAYVKSDLTGPDSHGIRIYNGKGSHSNCELLRSQDSTAPVQPPSTSAVISELNKDLTAVALDDPPDSTDRVFDESLGDEDDEGDNSVNADVAQKETEKTLSENHQWLKTTLAQIVNDTTSRLKMPRCYKDGHFWVRPQDPVFVLKRAAVGGFSPNELYLLPIFIWLPHHLPGHPDSFKCECGAKLILHGYNDNPIARRVSTLAGQDYFLLANRFLCPLRRVNDKGCGKHYQGSDPWIIRQLPEFVQRAFPACLSARGGLDMSKLDVMKATFAGHFGTDPFSKMVRELKMLHHDRLETMYYCAAMHFGLRDPEQVPSFSKFEDPLGYVGCAPSRQYFESMFTAWFSIHRGLIDRVMSSLSATIIKADHTYKLTPASCHGVAFRDQAPVVATGTLLSVGTFVYQGKRKKETCMGDAGSST
ncbi:hypothetical protein B0H14DRAFT_3753374 [Mycena olivaceomarginata]|nr:hypothetical protein B0H14DRAFT_3753374 [Mycena olivaceomarginata]